LDTSKIAAKGALVKKQKSNFSKIVQEAVESMELEAEDKNVSIVQKVEAVGLVLLDPEEIFTVVKNLLENAIKFSRRGGEVKIKAKKKGDNLVVEVKDSGIGVSKADQKNLFTRFFQAEKNVPGTGLGLNICKQIIDAHKGRIWAKSKPGKGSSFHFSIPLK